MSREQSRRVAAMLRARPPTKGDMAARRAELDRRQRALEPVAPPPGHAVAIGPHLRALWMHPAAGPTRAVVLWLHGGGFMFGSADGYRALGHKLAVEAEVSVLLVDYRLAPEHPFPAALDDTACALAWLEAGGYGPLVLGGDSAGGNLAAAAIQDRLRDGGTPPAGAWLLSPYLDLTHAGESIVERAASDAFIDGATMAPLATFYANGASVADPRVSPLFGPVDGFPPALVQVGSDEILFDDSRRFALRLWAAGRHCVFQEWVGQTHVFPLFMADLDEGRAALAQGAHFVRRVLGLESGGH